MNNKLNKTMYNTIINWGIPPIDNLNKDNLVFIFNSNHLSPVPKDCMNLHCKNNSAKFCLYDIENKKVIFSMDFFAQQNSSLLKLTNTSPFIKLELLNVSNPNFRNKGIASYYLEKLKDYAVKNNFSCIKVNPNPHATIFKSQSSKNSLSLGELKSFYKKHSTDNIEIKFSDEMY